MNQSLRVIDCAQPSQPGTAVNWQLCIICQQDAPSQALVCPSLAKKRLSGDGYVTLEKDLLGFESIGHLPSHIALRGLDDRSGIANTLRTNCARWHKSCRDALNATKLSRAQKRKFSTLLESEIPAVDDPVVNTAELPAVTRSASLPQPRVVSSVRKGKKLASLMGDCGRFEHSPWILVYESVLLCWMILDC